MCVIRASSLLNKYISNNKVLMNSYLEFWIPVFGLDSCLYDNLNKFSLWDFYKNDSGPLFSKSNENCSPSIPRQLYSTAL